MVLSAGIFRGFSVKSFSSADNFSAGIVAGIFFGLTAISFVCSLLIIINNQQSIVFPSSYRLIRAGTLENCKKGPVREAIQGFSGISRPAGYCFISLNSFRAVGENF